MKRTFRSTEIVGIGEAMVEFAALGDDLYRRGFAGDTLNTCWHLAQLLKGQARVGYATRIGADAFSQAFVDFLGLHGLDAAHVQRDAERAMGLYVISLAGAERSFSYWRDASAARRLADDPGRLAAAMANAALIHVSGITLAVIGAAGRRRLFAALAEARAAGAVVSFDPNVRLRLWTDVAELRAASAAMCAATDIALPSFDDEALVWGDADPDATLSRFAAAGVEEIVVKNGAGEVALRVAGRSSGRRRRRRRRSATPRAPGTPSTPAISPRASSASRLCRPAPWRRASPQRPSPASARCRRRKRSRAFKSGSRWFGGTSNRNRRDPVAAISRSRPSRDATFPGGNRVRRHRALESAATAARPPR